MGDAAPPVSFVIPSRNQARYIRQCLDGCLAQRIPGAEILVFDGASTDDTPGVLAGYGERIRWRSAPDRGQSDAINQGVRAARGDIIAWINSDDYYAADDVLARVLARFAADPTLDVVHGDGWMVDADGRRFRRYHSRELDRGRALLAHPTAVVQPALFFRRALFLDVGGLREELHWAMDLDLWMRLFPAARRVAYVAEPLACLRCHEDAKTYRGMLKQIREVGQIKRRYAPSLRPDLAMRLGSVYADAKLYVYWAAVRLGLWKAA
jgi:glycosyltransferase involved in cell wall biosynthesis